MCLILANTLGYSQELDSLKSLLDDKQLSDTTRVDILNELAFQLWNSDPEATLKYANEALEISEDLSDKKRLALAHKVLGIHFWSVSDYDKSLDNYYEALELLRELKDTEGQATIHNNIGIVFWDREEFEQAIDSYEILLKLSSDSSLRSAVYNNLSVISLEVGKPLESLMYSNKSIATLSADTATLISVYINKGNALFDLNEDEKALNNYFKSVDLAYANNDLFNQSKALINIGDIYKEENKYDLSHKYLSEALLINRKLDNKAGIGNSLTAIGGLEISKGNLDSARIYLNEALNIYTELGKKSNLSNIYIGLGSIYSEAANWDEAEKYFLKAVYLNEELNNPFESSYTSNRLSQLYFKVKSFRKAREYANRGLRVANEYNILNEKVTSHLMLAKLDSVQKDYKSAYFHRVKFSEYKAEKDENNLKVLDLGSSREIAKREKENELLRREKEIKDKELDLSQSESQRNLILLLIMSFALVGFVFLAIKLYQFNQEKQKAYVMLESLNTEIIQQKQEILLQAEKLKEANKEISLMNRSLEKKVDKRTRELKLQNDKIIQYAYINAHKLRAPVARILGLIYLINNNPTEQELNDMLERLDTSAKELDEVVRSISDTLAEERPDMVYKQKREV